MKEILRCKAVPERDAKSASEATSEGRPHKSQPICLAVGKGKKTKSEAERLGAEWLAEQGINTEASLAKATLPTVTFCEQSDTWLSWLQTRNNKPIPQTSVPSIRSALKCWLLPALGDLPLSQVDELALNGLVKKMVGKRSPKTITTYINLAKEVVESQRDGKGNGFLIHSGITKPLTFLKSTSASSVARK